MTRACASIRFLDTCSAGPVNLTLSEALLCIPDHCSMSVVARARNHLQANRSVEFRFEILI